jgi:hypothetical protein
VLQGVTAVDDASSADASALRSSLFPLSHSTTLDLGVVYNRYPFPPPENESASSSCDQDGSNHPSITFWQASSYIRLVPPLVSAAADLYARNVFVLRQQIEEAGTRGQHAGDRSLCLHWRRSDFKT